MSSLWGRGGELCPMIWSKSNVYQKLRLVGGPVVYGQEGLEILRY